MTEQNAAVAVHMVEDEVAPLPSTAWQTGVGCVVMLCAGLWALGTLAMPDSSALMLGGGARLVPALCAIVLLVCGVWLVWEARHGGWRNASTLSGYIGLQVTPWVWVSAGLLLGGCLMGFVGFVLAGAVCYALALQGLRLAVDAAAQNRMTCWVKDFVWGIGLAALIFLLFTQVIGIALPIGGLLWK